MAAHPAFTSDGQNGYILGRPAQIPAITGGIRPADLEPGTAARHAARSVEDSLDPDPSDQTLVRNSRS